MTGEAVVEATRVFEQVYKDLGAPAGALPGLPIWWFFARAFVIIYFFPIEHDVEKNRQKSRDLQAAGEDSGGARVGRYRTHIAFMDDIAEAYPSTTTRCGACTKH